MKDFKAVFNLGMFGVWTVFGTFMALGVPPNDRVITLIAISLAANSFVGLIEHILRK